MDESIQLAKLWVTLDQIKSQLDNTAIPLGSHLSIEDPDLMRTMEILSDDIAAHFKKFKLVAEARKLC